MCAEAATCSVTPRGSSRRSRSGNPQLRASGNYTRDRISGRNALRTTLSNVSEVTGQRESVSLTTTQLSDGRVLYLIGVSPQKEARVYEDAFQRVRQSIQLSDR